MKKISGRGGEFIPIFDQADQLTKEIVQLKSFKMPTNI